MRSRDSQPALSVVICTYNRPDLVAQVLGTLADQDAPRDGYEVLVIDNASPRDIAGVAASFDGRVPGLRCIREEQVGLSHARNRGWREALGEYVGYVDDDCKLPKEWVSTALRVIAEVRPVMFGGPYGAFYMTPKPKWYRDEYGSSQITSHARRLRHGEFITGMNMVFRREVFDRVGGFRTDLGMTGTVLAYGEETELQIRIGGLCGESAIWYEPDLLVYHLVRPEKMTWRWIIRHRMADGRYYARLAPGRLGDHPTTSRIVLACIRSILGLAWGPVRGFLARDRRMYPYFGNYLYEKNLHNLFDFGYAIETWRLHLGRQG